MSTDHDDDHTPTDVAGLTGHAVIAGFGVPGRAVADLVHAQGMSFCVIERNLETIERCRKAGLCMVEGDAGDPDTLRRAGIDRASLFVCAVPNDQAMYDAVETARSLNPRVQRATVAGFISMTQ